MLAEEFKTIVANGKIQIPDSIKTQSKLNLRGRKSE